MVEDYRKLIRKICQNKTKSSIMIVYKSNLNFFLWYNDCVKSKINPCLIK